MEIRNLNAFLKVAVLKNFTQAARDLGYAQSNISAQIAQLEQELGVLPYKLCFNCFMNGKFIEVPFDKSTYEKVKQWAVEEIKYIENVDDFYPRFDWFYCRNLCGYHNECCYYEDWKKGAR